MDAHAIALLIPIVGMALGGLVLVGLYKVFVRWMDRGKTEGSDSHEHAERIASLEGRIGELEERLDFAERVIAQRRERAELPPT